MAASYGPAWSAYPAITPAVSSAPPATGRRGQTASPRKPVVTIVPVPAAARCWRRRPAPCCARAALTVVLRAGGGPARVTGRMTAVPPGVIVPPMGVWRLRDERTDRAGRAGSVTVVLDASGLLWASQQHRVEAGLAAQPGVRAVEANAVAQTVTVGYDPTETSVTALRRFVTDCGLHCAGQLVFVVSPCDPAAEPVAMTDLTGDGGPAPSAAVGAAGHGVQHGYDMAAMATTCGTASW